MHEALELLKKYDTVIIHRHTNPDGDAMGSQIGLKNLLLDNFPEKKVYVVGDGAGRFSFMDGSVMEGDPHRMLEGMMIAGVATGATKGYIYVRAEYPMAVARLHTAIEQAQEHGAQVYLCGITVAAVDAMPAYLKLGIRTFSAEPAALLPLKKLLMEQEL